MQALLFELIYQIDAACLPLLENILCPAMNRPYDPTPKTGMEHIWLGWWSI
jgi:hypothetical protein